MNKKIESTENKNELSVAERFTNAVVKSFRDIAKGIEVTPKQMGLISNYYIKLNETFRDPKINIKWNQIRLPELATTLAHMAKLNLDMQLGHLSFIPFKHGDTGTYDLVPVISKSGYWYIVKNYGLYPPDSYVIELVYSTDKFTVTKKDSTHECDSYTFEITNPFDRGEIIGGFGYLEYEDKTKNKILVMSEKEILKYRRAKYSQEFWSGENMKKMYEKTIAKQLFKRIPLDPDKVNDVQVAFNQVDADELNFSKEETKSTIDEKIGSGDFIDIEFTSVNEESEEESENLNGESEIDDVKPLI